MYLKSARLQNSKNPHGPLSREERALCRVMYDHGATQQEIARKMARKVHCIQKTITNSYRSPDNVDQDYTIISDEMQIKYPQMVNTLLRFGLNNNTLRLTPFSQDLDDLAPSLNDPMIRT